jgi:hypothetical protein
MCGENKSVLALRAVPRVKAEKLCVEGLALPFGRGEYCHVPRGLSVVQLMNLRAKAKMLEMRVVRLIAIRL